MLSRNPVAIIIPIVRSVCMHSAYQRMPFEVDSDRSSRSSAPLCQRLQAITPVDYLDMICIFPSILAIVSHGSWSWLLLVLILDQHGSVLAIINRLKLWRPVFAHQRGYALDRGFFIRTHKIYDRIASAYHPLWTVATLLNGRKCHPMSGWWIPVLEPSTTGVSKNECQYRQPLLILSTMSPIFKTRLPALGLAARNSPFCAGFSNSSPPHSSWKRNVKELVYRNN